MWSIYVKYFCEALKEFDTFSKSSRDFFMGICHYIYKLLCLSFFYFTLILTINILWILHSDSDSNPIHNTSPILCFPVFKCLDHSVGSTDVRGMVYCFLTTMCWQFFSTVLCLIFSWLAIIFPVWLCLCITPSSKCFLPFFLCEVKLIHI